MQASQAIQKVTDNVKGNVFVNSPVRRMSSTVQDHKLAEIADVIRTYRGVDFAGKDDDNAEALRWFDGPWFDVLVCFIVLLNIFMIGLEMDLRNDDEKGYDRHAGWIICDWAFCLAFVAEIAVKVYFHTLQWFRMDPFSWIALLVSVFACVDTLILMPLKLSGDLRMFSLVRCVVLFRLVRVIQYVKLLKELKQVLIGLADSMISLAWALGVLVMILYIFAIWMTTLVGYNSDYNGLMQLTNGWDNVELFGSIGRSMWTLLQMITLDAWSSSIARHIIVQNWYMVFVIIPFLLITTYGVINIILSVIIEQMVASSQMPNAQRGNKGREDAAKEAEQNILKDIFMLANVEVAEKLTLESFQKACAEDVEVTWRLRQLELPPDEVMRLFQVMDGDGSRPLAVNEFVEGCTKMKGPARSKDLLALQSQADAMAKQMDQLGRQLQYSEKMLANLDDTTQRMGIRLGHTIESSQRRLAKSSIGTGTPIQSLPPEKRGMEGPSLHITNQPRLPKLPNLVE
jgi:voltage-gated sodium channel